MKLKFLDRFLTLWIFLSIALGLSVSVVFPQFVEVLNSNLFSSGSTNWLLAIGLLLMMFPPFVKVKYQELPAVFKDVKLLGFTLLFNWIIAPLVMFTLACIFMQDNPEYFTGLILIGIAPCIAMVLVWSELAGGNREYGTGLVALNSILQILLFSGYAWFLLSVLPAWVGLKNLVVDIPMSEIAKTVGIYLGIPFLAGYITRKIVLNFKGDKWLNQKFIPFISPLTLIALLFTIFLMFSLKGASVLELPFEVIRVAIPLLLFFLILFMSVFFIAKSIGISYEKNVTVSLTASSNNFELAIAVSIGVFGLQSGEAFAGIIGPLVEVPIMLALVKFAKNQQKKYSKS
ncbi:MAG: ACR3 family arsenite efflux transporter [Bacteroidia bacterium]|nr:ACR3 family arsenite efflux transporter [Bacteroidia bacterium]MCF8425297.1 ACR3 family arsenite efflux transporter [Bacteroidia bacterium]